MNNSSNHVCGTQSESFGSNDCQYRRTLKVYQLIKHPYYQNCARYSIATVYVSKKHTEPKIPGMTLVAERPHNKHGISVFVRDGLKVNSISVCEEENVEFITVELPSVVVHTLYKPPPEPFLLPPLGQRIKKCSTLAQLRSGYCRLLGSYKKDASLDVCADCGTTPHDVKHLSRLPGSPNYTDTVRPMEQTDRRCPELSYLEARDPD